ncbi:MAG: RnfABCDGE type electron transport complex subunit D [Lachnospiraceae bacterium]|nr:RnfABCDGE type electron transport complex subunit D [Lachnospiraceae bacterium]
MNENMYNISSSPHIRQDLTVTNVMGNVVIALLPATIFGIYRFGLHALIIIIAAILSTTLSEFVFDFIAKKPNTVKDLSAVVTGLLLALSLPPSVPVYIPIIGGMFAIFVVKCFFGGLGKNWMNPALGARCFLLISFGTTMTRFTVDGVSAATPLAAMKAGETIRLADVYLGFSNSVIGGSALALLIGGLYLWVSGGITITIPASCIIAFTAFIAIFGGQGFDIPFLIANICAGGILMGAFFMATDPVTSPMTTSSQILFGVIIGLLAGLFRVKGSAADSVSYAIIISNMFVPFLDKLPVPKPLGYKSNGEYKEFQFPMSAVNLCAITLVAGLALSGVFAMTKDKIDEQKMLANAESYKAVLPEAETFSFNDDLTAAVEALGGETYDSASFGRTYINDVIVGEGADGSVVGYVISATSAEGFEGNVTMSVGLGPDGTMKGIAFTELNETAGMGMRVDEDVFKDQFKDVKVDSFTLNKAGGSTADNEIDSVSGASTTSGAVVNAVNTALAFYAEHIA